MNDAVIVEAVRTPVFIVYAFNAIWYRRPDDSCSCLRRASGNSLTLTTVEFFNGAFAVHSPLQCLPVCC